MQQGNKNRFVLFLKLNRKKARTKVKKKKTTFYYQDQ